jgi:hypothetical protein
MERSPGIVELCDKSGRLMKVCRSCNCVSSGRGGGGSPYSGWMSHTHPRGVVGILAWPGACATDYSRSVWLPCVLLSFAGPITVSDYITVFKYNY